MRRLQFVQIGIFLVLLALGISMVPGRGVSAAADMERISSTDGTTLQLSGIGLYRQLNEDMYLGALYLPHPVHDAVKLLEPAPVRRMQIRVLAERLYGSGIERHFRDLIVLNNPREDVLRDASQLQRFSSSFKAGLMRGDEITIEVREGKSTRISINGQALPEFSASFFDLLLHSWVGDRAPSVMFRSGIIGQQENRDRAALISRYMTTVANAGDSVEVATDVKAVAVKPPELPKVETAKTETAKADVTKTTESAKLSPPKTAAVVATNSSPVKDTVIIATTPRDKPSGSSTLSSANGSTSLAQPNTLTPTNNASIDTLAKPITQNNPALALQSTLAPTAAAAVPDENEINQLLNRYQQALHVRLQSMLVYPKREMKRKYGVSQMARQKAPVVLRLHLDKAGDVTAAWLQKKSGEVLLDSTALNLVDSAAPYEPLPSALPDDVYEVLVDLLFDPDQ